MGELRTVAALFVDPKGPYASMNGVEIWTKERDARLYDGPHPVVAHPPCERWGNYWFGGPHPKQRRRELGDDDGCFEAAIRAVRKYGGVLEHPAGSRAWKRFGISHPRRDGGWSPEGLFNDHNGWTTMVEQGHYGHLCRKPTWLYVVSVGELPVLTEGPSKSRLVIDSSGTNRKKMIRCGELSLINRESSGGVPGTMIRKITPQPFAKLLVSIARLSR